MAYTREQIGQALKAAHEAGDVEAARTLAIAYRDWKPAAPDPVMNRASERANMAVRANEKIAPSDLAQLGRLDFSGAAMSRLPAPTMRPEELDAFDAQRAAEKERLRVPDSNLKERLVIGSNIGTFGHGPQAMAGASTVGALLATPFVEGDIIDREGVSGAMSSFLDDARVHQRRAREERPLESFGTEIVGGLLQGKTFIDTLGRKFLPKTNTVSNVGRVVGTGTGYGTLYGLGQSESDTLQGALGDAAYGGATGAAFGLGFKAAEPAITAGYRSAKTGAATISDALSDLLGKAGGARDKVAQEVALAAVRRSMERSGMTFNQIMDLVKKYEGKPAVLAEIIGQDALNALTALTRRPGSTSQKATDIAEARATMLPDRAKGDLEDASGIQIGNIDETLTKQLDERQAAAKPLYDALYKKYRTIESFRQPGQTGQVQKRLNRLARTPLLQRHLELADKAMRTSAAVRGIAVSKMSVMERWDLVKRSLDDAIDSAVAKGEARTKVGESVGDLVRLKEELVGELDRLTGDAYAAARLVGGEAPRLRAAATAGQKAIGARSPKEVAKTVAATLAQDLPAMQAGMVDDIATRIDKPGFSPRRFRSPDLSGKVRAVFGEEAGNRFLQKMDAEAELAMKGSRWAPNVNSVTGTVMESGATAMGDDLINAGFDLATGNKVGLVRQAINFMRQRGFSQRQIDAIGDLLLSSPEEGLRRLQVIKPEGPPVGLAAPVAGGAPSGGQPPTGGTPAANAPTPPPQSGPIRSAGFIGRGDLGNAAIGAGFGAFGPADSNEERLRNMAIGAGIGLAPGAINRVRGVGRTVGRGVDDVAAQGVPRTPQQAARFETPGSPEYEAAVAQGLDMSEAGRMRRAKEMGYTEEGYIPMWEKDDYGASEEWTRKNKQRVFATAREAEGNIVRTQEANNEIFGFNPQAYDGRLLAARKAMYETPEYKSGNMEEWRKTPEYETYKQIEKLLDRQAARGNALARAELVAARLGQRLNIPGGRIVGVDEIFGPIKKGKLSPDVTSYGETTVMLPVTRFIDDALQGKNLEKTVRKYIFDEFGEDALLQNPREVETYIKSLLNAAEWVRNRKLSDEVESYARWYAGEGTDKAMPGIAAPDRPPTEIMPPSIMRVLVKRDKDGNIENIRSVYAAFDPDKAASPILTAGFGASTPKPPKGRTVGKGRLGTRTADAAAIATLGLQGGTAEADTEDPNEKKLAELAQSQTSEQAKVDEYEQALKAFEAMPPTDKQTFLKNNGYTGRNGETINPDGDVRGITGFAIETYRNKINADIATAKAERDKAKTEANRLEVAMAMRPQKETNPLIDKLQEGAVYGAMIYGAHRFRKGRLDRRQGEVDKVAAKANALLTRLPVPPDPPRRTLYSRVPKLGDKQMAQYRSAANAQTQAQLATEERLAGRVIPAISRDVTSPDGLPNRLANVNEFDRQAAAGDFGPVSRIGRFMEPVNSRFTGVDVSLIGGGLADAHIMQGMLDKTRAEIKAEEKKIADEQQKDEADQSAALFNNSYRRLEQLRTTEQIQLVVQRVGVGLAIGGTVALGHGRFARAQPRYEAAARERDLINRAMAPPPPPQAARTETASTATATATASTACTATARCNRKTTHGRQAKTYLVRP